MRCILCTLLILFIISCNKPEQRNNEITKVELATGPCVGPCPVTAVSIDTSLNCRFYGGSHAQKKGYYTGKVAPKIWDSINVRLEAIDYKNLHIKYDRPVDDQTIELIIHYKNNKVKHVLAGSFDIAQAKNGNNIGKVLYWISDIYKSTKLKFTKSSVRFETTVQNASKIIHKNDTVKFPPPDWRP